MKAQVTLDQASASKSRASIVNTSAQLSDSVESLHPGSNKGDKQRLSANEMDSVRLRNSLKSDEKYLNFHQKPHDSSNKTGKSGAFSPGLPQSDVKSHRKKLTCRISNAAAIATELNARLPEVTAVSPVLSKELIIQNQASTRSRFAQQYDFIRNCSERLLASSHEKVGEQATTSKSPSSTFEPARSAVVG